MKRSSGISIVEVGQNDLRKVFFDDFWDENQATLKLVVYFEGLKWVFTGHPRVLTHGHAEYVQLADVKNLSYL